MTSRHVNLQKDEAKKRQAAKQLVQIRDQMDEREFLVIKKYQAASPGVVDESSDQYDIIEHPEIYDLIKDEKEIYMDALEQFVDKVLRRSSTYGKFTEIIHTRIAAVMTKVLKTIGLSIDKVKRIRRENLTIKRELQEY